MSESIIRGGEKKMETKRIYGVDGPDVSPRDKKISQRPVTIFPPARKTYIGLYARVYNNIKMYVGFSISRTFPPQRQCTESSLRAVIRKILVSVYLNIFIRFHPPTPPVGHRPV